MKNAIQLHDPHSEEIIGTVLLVLGSVYDIWSSWQTYVKHNVTAPSYFDLDHYVSFHNESFGVLSVIEGLEIDYIQL